MPGELRFANEGLSHDDEFWYFTGKFFFYKVNKAPLQIVQETYHAIPDELKEQGYDHIGDVEVLDGILYGGMEGKSPGILGRWNTTTLEIIDYQEIPEQSGAPWVTIDPYTKLLYSSDWNSDTINIYDSTTLTLVKQMSMVDVEGYPKEIQGASFYKGDLYLATNVEDGVFKLNIETGAFDLALKDDDNYVIDKYYYEMEGLTFWDLSEEGFGQMHMYGNFMNGREKAIHNFKEA